MTRFFLLFCAFSLILAQDAPAPVAAQHTPATASPSNNEGILRELNQQRELLGSLSRKFDPVAEAVKSIESAVKSQESLPAISAIQENIKSLEASIGSVSKSLADAEGSSQEEEFRKDVASRLNSLQTTVQGQQSSLNELKSKLKSILDQTKALEQLSAAQKSNTDTINKILNNQQTIFENQKKILTKLEQEKSFLKTYLDSENIKSFFAKVYNGTQEVVKNNGTTLLNQVGTIANNSLSTGQDLVVKGHTKLSDYLKKTFEFSESVAMYTSVAILTIPLALVALVIVSLGFKVLRIVGSIIFWPCLCCFRRRARQQPQTQEDVETKKRKVSEVENQASNNQKKKKTGK